MPVVTVELSATDITFYVYERRATVPTPFEYKPFGSTISDQLSNLLGSRRSNDIYLAQTNPDVLNGTKRPRLSVEVSDDTFCELYQLMNDDEHAGANRSPAVPAPAR